MPIQWISKGGPKAVAIDKREMVDKKKIWQAKVMSYKGGRKQGRKDTNAAVKKSKIKSKDKVKVKKRVKATIWADETRYVSYHVFWDRISIDEATENFLA